MSKETNTTLPLETFGVQDLKPKNPERYLVMTRGVLFFLDSEPEKTTKPPKSTLPKLAHPDLSKFIVQVKGKPHI